MAELNARQKHILELLQQRADRDLYETAGATPAVGSGMYAVTYSGDLPPYDYLTQSEVEYMHRRGLIEERWPGCYKLTGSERRNRKGQVIR